MSAEAWLFGWSGAETSLLGEYDFLLGHKRSLSLIESGSIGLRLLLVETGLLPITVRASDRGPWFYFIYFPRGHCLSYFVVNPACAHKLSLCVR